MDVGAGKVLPLLEVKAGFARLLIIICTSSSSSLYSLIIITKDEFTVD
jgi:hypothetical protein